MTGNIDPRLLADPNCQVIFLLELATASSDLFDPVQFKLFSFLLAVGLG
jgi:hypothetical protein